MTPLQFNLSLTTEEATGEVLSLYFFIRDGKVHETREFNDGLVLADYNKFGELVGIELLGPCTVEIVDLIQGNEPKKNRDRTKGYILRNCPRSFIAAA